ncbi:MAG: DUF4340 domain-containing protein [Gammaproteobacteria bacterium]|nr:DUF4340 domain-containing protein [Gammaproteobacteria bacterium]
MKINKQWLKGLLILQIALAAILFWRNQDNGLPVEQLLLPEYSADKIDKLVVSSQDASVTIEKQGEDWLLPQLQNLPANKGQVSSALQKLAKLKLDWPVTTSSNSHQRFELGEDNFQRRILLQQGDNNVGELLLGTSPGFRKVHLRIADDNNVYALELNSYDFPDKTDQWLNKSLLQVKKPKSIKAPGFTLLNNEESWELQQSDGSTLKAESLDNEKVKRLTQTLASLTVTGVAGLGIDLNAEAAIEIEVTDDTAHRFQFLSKEDRYFVKRDDRDTVFTLNKSVYEQIANMKSEDFLLLAEEPVVNAESS